MAVYDDITARKRDEEKIRGNDKRLQALSEILNHETEDNPGFSGLCTRTGALPDRKQAWVYLFLREEKQEFTLNSWSREVMEACSVQDPQTTYQLEKTGIWGEAVRQRKTDRDKQFPGNASA